jgi:hypothetical protein
VVATDVRFDRARALGQLEAAWTRRGAQLITVWGRRRNGKSTLLSRGAACQAIALARRCPSLGSADQKD